MNHIFYDMEFFFGVIYAIMWSDSDTVSWRGTEGGGVGVYFIFQSM